MSNIITIEHKYTKERVKLPLVDWEEKKSIFKDRFKVVETYVPEELKEKVKKTTKAENSEIGHDLKDVK